MKLLLSLFLFATPVFAAQYSTTDVINDNFSIAPDVTHQCAFTVKKWVGDVYIDTINVYKLVTEHGERSTKISLNGLNYRQIGCSEGGFKKGIIRVQIKGIFELSQIDTGFMSWLSENNMSLDIEDSLPNCWKADITTQSWCTYNK